MRYRGQKAEFDSMESKKWQQEDRPLRTIFHKIRFSSLPEHEKTVIHFTEEAVAYITAGDETTAATLQRQSTAYSAHLPCTRDSRMS